MRRLMMPTIVLVVAASTLAGCGKNEKTDSVDAPTSSSVPSEPGPGPADEETQGGGSTCDTPSILDMDGQGKDAVWAGKAGTPVTVDGKVKIDPAGKKVTAVSLLVAPLDDTTDDSMTKPIAKADATVTSRATDAVLADASLELTPTQPGDYSVLVHVDYAGTPGCKPGETGDSEETVGVLTVH